MIGSNNSDIADPIMEVVYDQSQWMGLQIGLPGKLPVIAMDNNAVEFVTVMPVGFDAPARISGITYTTVPAVLFTHQPVLRFDETLAGTRTIADGYADFIVVVPRNGFASAANKIAGMIADLFPTSCRIDMLCGLITVMRPPMPMAGYDDGVYYRVPVRIAYRAN